MTEDQKQQLTSFLTAALGDEDWQREDFRFMDGWETVEALWPMNELYRPIHALVGSLPYDPAYEDEADAALARLARGEPWNASSPSPGAWRVLMERQIQSIILALANDHQRNHRVVPIPQRLPPASRTLAAVLFLQWSMKLPFEVDERSSYEWPRGPAPASLRRH